MKRINPHGFRVRRLVLISLLSVAGVAALLAFAASASRRTSRGTNASLGKMTTKSDRAQNPNAPAAAVIVATLSDNTAAATRVTPGGTINYTATVTNNGAASPADDATNLNFSAPLDANTTLVAGSVHASPIAFNDIYNWVGNTQLDTVARALPTVIANDVAVNAPAGTDTFTVTGIAGGATALGGVVTLASPSGSFVYTPPLGRPNIGDGATAQDSFTYTITNNADPALTSTGTVRINLTGRVWYLVAGGVGDGRSNTPSGSPSAMSTAADKSTDVFYIFSNAASLNGPFSVDAGQQLLGQGVNLVVSAITLFNSAAPTPTTTNTAGSCVALAGAPGNNTLSGFNIGNCTGGTAIIGANVGTLNVSTLSINTNGGALDLTGVGAPTVSVVLGGTTSTGGAKNVNLVGLNGTVTLAGGALSGSTAGATNHAFAVSGGGNAAITYSGNITKANQGNVVNIAGRTGGTITLSGTINGTGSNGINVGSNTGGTIDFSGATKTLNTGANAAVTLATNTGSTINFSGGGLDIDTTSGAGFSATGGGTVNVTSGGNLNTIDTTTGTGFNITSTTIGASNVTFRSISSNGAANGIVLNATGATGSLIVQGSGSVVQGGDNSGGTIQNTTGDAISLTNTTSPSFNNMNIQTPAGNGVFGTQVANFAFTNGKINNAGDASNESCASFSTLNSVNATGTFTFTNSQCTQTEANGVDIQNYGGTLSDVNISNNQFTDTGDVATPGSAVLLITNSTASTDGVVTKASLNNNNIVDFRAGAGFVLQANSDLGGTHTVTYGTAGSGTNVITVTGNLMNGGNGGIGNQPDRFVTGALNGRGTANYNVSTNGTIANPIQKIDGVGIELSNFGPGTMSATVNSNRMVVNNAVASAGIGIGCDADSDGTTVDNGTLTLIVDGNNVSQTDGQGIFAIARNSTCTLNTRISNNTAAAPATTSAARSGIQVSSGSAAGDTTLCLDIHANTTAGSTNTATSTTSPGIAIRKQGTVQTVNEFGIEGLAPSPATGAQTEVFVTAQNPGSASGTFGTGGTASLSGNNYQACNVAPNLPNFDVNAAGKPPTADQEISFTQMLMVARKSKSWMNPTDVGKEITSPAIPDLYDDNSPRWSMPFVTQTPELASNTTKESSNIIASSPYDITGSSFGLASQPIETMAVLSKPLEHQTAVSSPALTIGSERSNRSDILSHHPVRGTSTAYAVNQNAPTSGENVTLNAIATLPAAGKSITIKYSATVNTTVLTARQASTQGTVTANGGISVQTDDPDVGGVQATITLLDTTLTWTGVTSTDWNDATNWNRPGPVVSSYAPGVTNPAVNDVVIPNVGNQPNIGTTDINIFSLNLANGRTLTIGAGRNLTIGGSPGGDLTLDGIISGGTLTFGSGTHNLNNAGGTGSLSATNAAVVISGSTVTLNNNLQGGTLNVNAGGSMNITNRTLSLNGAGAALTAAGTFTVTGSTVVFNGSAAQTTGTVYNNLTINNAAGVTLTSSSTVNGTLALTSGDLNTGAFSLTQPNTTASTGTGDVVGTVIRSGGPFALATPLTFGNPNNNITFTVGTSRPTTLTVVLAKSAPATFAAAVQRNYTISQTGTNNSTATVRFRYLDSELNGNTEASLNLRRLRTADSHWVAQLPTTRDTANNWVESNAVLSTDIATQWTFSMLVPTASAGTVTGRIVDQSGNPVEGAVVRLEGTQNRKFITDANGVYSFVNVETNGFYTVTPSRANYTFSPAVRSFSQLGETTEAAFGATLVSGGFVNPLDTPEYFVRQHYLDFLGREPDEAGFNFWSDQILECAGDVQCSERRRENVSAAYFLSIEFRKTGGLVDGLYRASYGVAPQYAAFMPDTRAIGLGVQVGKDGWEELLRTNTEAFVNSFVNRPEFHQLYDGMDNSLFVDTLISHTGVTFTAAERDALVSGLGTGTMTRAEALRSIAEDGRFVNAKFNQTFVMMEYYGYLRRDYDAGGYAFWLNKLNEFNGNFEQAEMVKAFIVSGEYRDRFSR